MNLHQHTQIRIPKTLTLENSTTQFSNKATSIKSTKLKTPTSTLKQSTLKSPGSHKKRNFNSTSRLPCPNIELEDGLVSQLSVNDVISNCIATNGAVSNLGNNESVNNVNPLRPVASQMYHRCYSNSALNPIWMVYNSIDKKHEGKVNMLALQPLIQKLSSFTLPDRQFSLNFNKKSGKINFSEFRSYVTDNLDMCRIDEGRVAMTCWNLCKHNYLHPPYIDEHLPVVTDTKICTLFWLFCVFCRLSEPGIYPPVIDYEEAELLMRKMMCCLGVSWSNSDHTNDDSQSALTDDYDTTKLLLVTFQQLLSIIPDMAGNEIVQSDNFYNAIKWICLTEFKDVLKSGWMQVKKSKQEWRRRWVVLGGNYLTYYSSKQNLVMKNKILLTKSMNVESLPPTHDRKYQLRVVVKDDDLTISREEQFLVTNERDMREWLHLINMCIKLHCTGMTAKYAEIAERRYERHRRRQSLKSVSEKRKEVNNVRNCLQRIRQERIELNTTVGENKKKMHQQLDILNKMNKVYDEIHQIHKNDFNLQIAKNKLLINKFEQTPADDLSTIFQLVSECDVKLSNDVIKQRTALEEQLKQLRSTQSSIPKPEKIKFAHETFHHATAPSRSDSCYDTLESSENSR